MIVVRFSMFDVRFFLEQTSNNKHRKPKTKHRTTNIENRKSKNHDTTQI
jgi:hypothetical protein